MLMPGPSALFVFLLFHRVPTELTGRVVCFNDMPTERTPQNEAALHRPKHGQIG